MTEVNQSTKGDNRVTPSLIGPFDKVLAVTVAFSNMHAKQLKGCVLFVQGPD